MTFLQVLARTVFHTSAVWSEELARLTYGWMVLLGVAVLVKDDGLIRVTILADRLRGRTGKILRLVTDLAVIPFVGAMTWGAWTNTRLNWNTFAPTVDWMRIGYTYLIIFISGLIMLWYLVGNFVRQARTTLEKAAHGPEGWQ